MSDSDNVTEAEKAVVMLTGCQEVRSAPSLHQAMIELMGTGKKSVVDCSTVDSLDSACLQILLATKREAQENVQILAGTNTEASRWIGYSGLSSELLED